MGLPYGKVINYWLICPQGFWRLAAMSWERCKLRGAKGFWHIETV
jgi:hypothetical protein